MQIVEPRERARVAMQIFGVRHAADRTARGEPRLVRGQTTASIFIFEQREMSGHFSLELVFRGLMPEDCRQTQQDSPEPGHGYDSFSSSLSTSPASRRHRSACLSSARAPALVMA